MFGINKHIKRLAKDSADCIFRVFDDSPHKSTRMVKARSTYNPSDSNQIFQTLQLERCPYFYIFSLLEVRASVRCL